MSVVWFNKISIPTSWTVLDNSEGVGFQSPQFCIGKYAAKLEFLEG